MARLFRSNRSQAVRLPKEAEFPEGVTEVDVVVEGSRRVLVPRTSANGWREFFERGSFLSDDFPEDVEDAPPRAVEPF